MRPYTRTLPEDATEEQIEEAGRHVRAHLSAVAAEDDDPETNADDVRVRVERQEGRVLVIGELDVGPNAPYLAPDFDAFADVPAELLAHVRDDEPEVSDGRR